MDNNEDFIVSNALRYQEMYLAEGRQRHDRVVPGPLVAEVFRYMENSMAGTSQYELERLLLGSDQCGSGWRRYVARSRDQEEKKRWRYFYGRYGRKDSAASSATEDPFFIQPPPLPSLDDEMSTEKPSSKPQLPLMRSLPTDGRSMSFRRLREVKERWSALAISRIFEKSPSADGKTESEKKFIMELLRHNTSLTAINNLLNCWEAAYELLAPADSKLEYSDLKAHLVSHFKLLESPEQKRKQKTKIKSMQTYQPTEL